MQKIHYHQHGQCPNETDHVPAGACDNPPDITLTNEFDCQITTPLGPGVWFQCSHLP